MILEHLKLAGRDQVVCRENGDDAWWSLPSWLELRVTLNEVQR
jgi:hypothetical protein